MNIFLTGVNGFIGSALYPSLIKRGYNLTCMLRKKTSKTDDKNLLLVQQCCIDNLNNKTDFKNSLKNIDVVIHLAGLAHSPVKSDYANHNKFLDINFHGTRNLALQAAKNSVKRFVFISTISVYGTSSEKKSGYTEEDNKKPYNSYTVSKLKAEQALRKIEKETGMEVVIIRPSLVYGPGVKANFLKLLNLVHARVPLPFAGINNKRSFIAIDNLVDAIAVCAVHKKARGQTFIVSDGKPLSTPQLLEKISKAMNMKPRLFFIPSSVFKFLLMLLRKQGIYQRLWGSLTVDSAKIRHCLGWQPKVCVDEGIYKTVKWYLEEKDNLMNVK